MTATMTCDQDAALTAAFLTRITPAARADLLAELRQELQVADLRAVYAAANRRPRQANDWTADIETAGELTVVPTDKGGVRIHHDATGLVLDVEGCWVDSKEALSSAAGEDATTWSHRGLAITAALATL